ncbi:AraC family transcriptional regulator [Psychrobacter celer]|uniref:AraC family transcriptional regulator n=1 Tax=Psychrobacter celer TaxID=306572 RepID=UPI003FD64293
MDALSVLLQNVHLFETKYYRLNCVGNWSYSLTRKDTILFYLVMSGSFCIDVGNDRREVHAGDIIMIPNTHQHTSYALAYLIDYRLRLAARYLRLQQNSISRISELVGYASDSTFSQAFKRVYGVSPKAYRQQYHG